MKNNKVTWWDTFCIQIGLCKELPATPTPKPPLSIPPPTPVLLAGPTQASHVEDCLKRYVEACAALGLDVVAHGSEWFSMKENLKDGFRKSGWDAACIIEFNTPTNSENTNSHFLPPDKLNDGFEAAIDALVAPRVVSFDSDFFRIDEDQVAGPVFRGFVDKLDKIRAGARGEVPQGDQAGGDPSGKARARTPRDR